MKFHLAVFGCQMNQNDADRIRTILQRIGGSETEIMEAADLVIFVTCSIRQHAEDRVFGLLHKLKKTRMNKNAISAVTGCMVRKTSTRESEKKDRLLTRTKTIDLVFRIEDAPELPNLLADFMAIPEEYRGEHAGIFETLPTQKQKHSAFVPISTGCDHHCTYCIVPHTRGKEICRPFDEIIAECEKMVEQGAKEITLIGQNVNRWYAGERGKNPYKTDFAVLLDAVARIPGVSWLRFLSPHPQHLGEDVIDVMATHSNICRHLHLPVQSGDNEMLRKMARGYTVEKFRDTLALARRKIPGLTVSTDIIVGFCGETEQQFQNSVELCQAEQFDQIFIGKFSVRPNTPAAKWPDDVPDAVKKARFHVLNDLLKETSRQNNLGYHNRELEVLIDKVDEKQRLATGHSNENKTVQFQVGSRGQRFVGSFEKVRILGSNTFFLQGELAAAVAQ